MEWFLTILNLLVIVGLIAITFFLFQINMKLEELNKKQG